MRSLSAFLTALGVGPTFALSMADFKEPSVEFCGGRDSTRSNNVSTVDR